MIDQINNQELGSSIRTKLNSLVTQANSQEIAHNQNNHQIYKVAFIDAVNYADTDALKNAYTGQIGTNVAIAVTNLGSGGIYELTNTGEPVLLTALFDGLTINDNEDNQFKKWDSQNNSFVQISQSEANTPTTSSVDLNTYTIPFDELQAPTDTGQGRPQGCLVFFSGQSNTERGAGIPADTSFDNVRTLTRNTVWNNINNEANWDWENFSSSFTYNLGRNTGTGNLSTNAYNFARQWQNAIDNGDNLPDLYLVQISHAGAGFGGDTDEVRPGHGMFNPTFNEDVRGGNGDFDDIPAERLSEFIPRVHRWAIRNLDDNNIFVRHLGLFWNQFEHDVLTADPSHYAQFLKNMLEQLEINVNGKLPITYMNPVAPWFTEDITRLPLQGEIQTALRNATSDRLANVISVTDHPSYDASAVRFGVYDDLVHYIAPVQAWIGEQVFANWITENNNYGQFILKGNISDAGGGTDNSAEIATLQTDVETAQTTADGKPNYSDLPTVIEWNAKTFPLGNISLPGVSVQGSPARTGVNRQLRVVTEGGRRFFENANHQQGNNLFYVLPSVPNDTTYFSFDIDFAEGSTIGFAIVFGSEVDETGTFASLGRDSFASILCIDNRDSSYRPTNHSLRTFRLSNTAPSISWLNFDSDLPYTNNTGGTGNGLTVGGRLSFRSVLVNDVHRVQIDWTPEGGTATTVFDQTMADVLGNDTFRTGDLGILFGVGSVVATQHGIRMTRIGGESLE